MIGFALVFILSVSALSGLAAFAVSVAGRRGWLRPALVERRAAELGAALPVALALVTVATLIIASSVGHDHCEVHAHHEHLCLTHGDGWLGHPWVAIILAIAAATVVTRLVLLLGRHFHAARSVARLRQVGACHDELCIVQSSRVFCFVAGLWRPRMYVSTAAWNGLCDDERAAMQAHERGHIRHRDLLWRLGMELLLIVAAPLVTGGLLSRWTRTVERLRDDDAARSLGDSEPVARAMVRLCRLGLEDTGPGLAFAARGDELSTRVEALLGNEPSGWMPARRLVLAGTTMSAVAACAVGVWADGLHHMLETLLG